MSDPFLVFAIALVVLAWAAILFVVEHWGAGFPARSVFCPHKNARAAISTYSYTKKSWGAVIERDVLQCSLLRGAPVTCDKACLTQL